VQFISVAAEKEFLKSYIYQSYPNKHEFTIDQELTGIVAHMHAADASFAHTGWQHHTFLHEMMSLLPS